MTKSSFVVEFQLDTVTFENNPKNEIFNIIKGIAYTIITNGVPVPGIATVIRDSNWNAIGTYYIRDGR